MSVEFVSTGFSCYDVQVDKTATKILEDDRFFRKIVQMSL